MLEPRNEDELADAIASADGPLSIEGGGTRGLKIDGTRLTTSGLTGITVYEPGALTIVAKSGTPVAEIEAALEAENQTLAFEPMDHRPLLGTQGEPTIGGIVATNTSGPRRVQAGACRDFLLGVRFVNGAGSIVKNGGRVMKNVTGYDLSRLMCGAHGTLGVLSEVSLKVLPKPETEATLIFEDISPDQAVPLMSAALGTPYDVSGACFGPYHFSAQRQACLRVEGTETSVTYRVSKLKEALSRFGNCQVEADPVKSGKIWRDVRDATALSELPFVARGSIVPSAAPAFLHSVSQTLATTSYLDWGGGLIWIGATEEQLQENAQHFALDTDDPGLWAQELFGGLSQYMRYEDGHLRLAKSPGRIDFDRFQKEDPALAGLAKALRSKYDPKGILNSGLMG